MKALRTICSLIVVTGWALPASVACGPASGSEEAEVIVPQTLAPGTPIEAKWLGSAGRGRYVLALLSDCGSCSVGKLDIRPRKRDLRMAILTIHKDQVAKLEHEWPGVPVFYDQDQSAVPSFCYVFAPQLMLVANGVLLDSAVGAPECRDKWKEWNR